MKKPVLIISHGVRRWAGQLVPILEELGHDTHMVAPRLGDPCPGDATKYAAIIIMGGPMGVYEYPTLPWLVEELAWVREAVKTNVPIFGICLGCQILSHVHGGEVRQGEFGRSIGFLPITLQEHNDEIFGHELDGMEMLKWHGDTYSLPGCAEQLAVGCLYPQQAARFGERIYGVQFHPEATPERIRHWHGEDLENGRPLPDDLPHIDKLVAMGEERLPAGHVWLKNFLQRLLES